MKYLELWEFYFKYRLLNKIETVEQFIELLPLLEKSHVIDQTTDVKNSIKENVKRLLCKIN